MAVQCKIDIPAVSGLQENQLTVGREFILSCEGDFPRDLQADKMQVLLAPEQKYSLQLLGFEFRNPTTAELKVTAYRAGDIRFDDLQITDGTQTVSLGSVQYRVETVLPPPQGGTGGGGQEAKQEPYPALGPASLPVPPLYWALLGTVIFLVLAVIAIKIFRIVQRKNILEKLREHDAAISPLSQFHQTIRRLQRSNPVFFGVAAPKEDVQEAFDTIHKAYLLFLTRQYKVPAFEWNERLVMGDLKKYHRGVYNEFQTDLRKLFREFRHGLKDKNKLVETDILNLEKRARVLMEKLEAHK